MTTIFARSLSLSAIVGLLVGCGGGGGGGGGSEAASADGNTYLVRATVTSDTCEERIGNVTQKFTFINSGGSTVVDTTVDVVPVTDSGSDRSFSYSEQTGNCNRTYSGTFSDFTDQGANVELTSSSDCGNFKCESKWNGTAVIDNQSRSTDFVEARVSGENCVPPVDDLFYRPSAFECNGNAFVGMITPRFRAAFSVVLRFNGFRNDRDPNNPECALTECSPYKTQKIIELPQHQIRCLGDNGNTSVMRMAKRISIKFQGTLAESEKQDPLKFEQYCLADTSAYLN